MSQQGQQGNASPLSDAFDRAVDALTSSNTAYALIGGFAAGYHGLPRPTRDVDFLYCTPNTALPRLLDAFHERGFTFNMKDVIRELTTDHLSTVFYKQVRVDLLDAVIPFFRRAVANAQDVDIGLRKVRIVTGEDLIALKMIAARDNDLLDVRGILSTQGNRLALDRICDSLEECCGRDRIDTLNKLLREAKLR